MMGRIECPNCSKQFDIKKISETNDTILTCPYCSYQFNIHPSSGDHCIKKKHIEECDWEEHGEPRKTILSSMKPRTDRPMIATFLLIIVICMGIIAAVIPNVFLQTPVILFSATGSQGSISFQLQNINSSTIDKVSLMIPSENVTYQGIIRNDSIELKNLPLGSYTGQLTLDWKNETRILSFDLFVIPILSNSYSLSSTNTDDLTIAHNDYGWCSAILLILSVICLIGMFSAWRRNHSDVALIGSFVGIFTIGFFFIGSILSIIAFYLLYQSRDEFDDGKKGKSF
jgi:DNA-directed RNA polymerase subunit RPC12/RpoP